ncbi:hypothetical protein HCA69_16065 [Listeria grandensis]|uniref:Uncharacterized protein n=1 Tax=Listeria grandensis TaxID=1494963 RepID=A0A7X0Y6Y3_9LIST|nr:hypothetical protein [Listeria grandensis]MBC1937878.1 hypothetical protein [Listeria grandensis]
MTENENGDKKLDLSPLISTSTLKRQTVKVKGTDDFGRSAKNTTPPNEQAPVLDKLPKKAPRIDPSEDFRKKATKTQKLSPDVILKIEVLKPYIKELEELNLDRKPTVNDIVAMLVDHYVNTKIPTRHLESYKAVYDNLYDQL